MAEYDPTIAFGLGKFSQQAYDSKAAITGALAGSEFFEFFEDNLTNTQGFVVKFNGHVIVAFRGTQGLQDLATDALTVKAFVNLFPPRRVHAGFLLAHRSVRDDIRTAIESLDPPRVFVTGHSLGGALATLAALDLAVERPSTQITIYNFGCPRLGDRGYVGYYNGKMSESFCVAVPEDFIANLPVGGWGPFRFRHVSQEHELENVAPPFHHHDMKTSYLPQLKEASSGVSFFDSSP